ncbi:hypothetical protein KI387_023911, partial [Taxus chinensis]
MSEREENTTAAIFFVSDGYGNNTHKDDIGNLAVYVFGFNDVHLLPYKEQPLGFEDVREQINVVGIFGSDVHYLKHMRNSCIALKNPMVLGHESVGIVIQTDMDEKHLPTTMELGADSIILVSLDVKITIVNIGTAEVIVHTATVNVQTQ